MAYDTYKLAKDLKKVVTEGNTKKISAYDTQAEVKRVEGNTLWVHIPGGVNETPVKKTVNAKKGDAVQVRIAGGKAWVTGNESNPPTDDTKANKVEAATKASVTYINALKSNSITVDSLTATSAYIQDLTSKNITTENLQATNAYIQDLVSNNITTNNIVADHATVGNLDVNYAKINAANITSLSAQDAWINKLMVQSGLLAHEGAIFSLDSIQVNASNITAGTIDVNRLIITDDSVTPPQKYLINFNTTYSVSSDTSVVPGKIYYTYDSTTGTYSSVANPTGNPSTIPYYEQSISPSPEKMDGNIVEPRTITADKIVAHDITVQEITTENLIGTNGWINLNQGKFSYTTNGSTWDSSTSGIMWDGTNLKIKGEVNVSGGNIYTKDEVDGIEIGGRNLLLDSDAPSFEAIAGTTFRYLSDSDQASYADGQFVQISDPPVNGIKYGYRLICSTAASSASQRGYAWRSKQYEPKINTIPGETYTLSCYVRKISGNPYVNQRYAYYHLVNGTETIQYVASSWQKITSTSWQKISWTFTYPSDMTRHGAIYPFMIKTDCVGTVEACGFKMEKGDKATEWTPAPENAFALSPKNILRGTNEMSNTYSSWENAGWYSSGNGGTTAFAQTISDSPISTLKTGVKITISTANKDQGFAQGGVPFAKRAITQSVWVKGPVGGVVKLQPLWKDSSGEEEGGAKQFTLIDGNWHRYEFTKTPNYAHSANGGYVYCQTSSGSGIFYVIGDKIEYGDKATDWNPGEEVIDYVTQIGNTGIKVHPRSGDSNRATITGDGFYVYKNNVKRAQYGDAIELFDSNAVRRLYLGQYSGTTDYGVIIGSTSNSSRVSIKDASISMIDSGGDTRVSLTTSGVTVGKSGAGRTYVTDTGVQIFDGNGDQRVNVTSSQVIIGKVAQNFYRNHIDNTGMHLYYQTGSTSSSYRNVADFGSTIKLYDNTGAQKVKIDSSNIILGPLQASQRGTVETRVTADGIAVYRNSDGNVAEKLLVDISGTVLASSQYHTYGRIRISSGSGASDYYTISCYQGSGGLRIAGGVVHIVNGLKINNHESAIGTIINAYPSSAVSVPTSTAKNLCSITLPAGVWVVNCGVRFPSNANGMRRMNLTTTSAAEDSQMQVPPVNGGITQLNMTRIISVTSSTTFYLNVWQNSGSSLSCVAGSTNFANYIAAVRIQ